MANTAAASQMSGVQKGQALLYIQMYGAFQLHGGDETGETVELQIGHPSVHHLLLGVCYSLIHSLLELLRFKVLISHQIMLIWNRKEGIIFTKLMCW